MFILRRTNIASVRDSGVDDDIEGLALVLEGESNLASFVILLGCFGEERLQRHARVFGGNDERRNVPARSQPALAYRSRLRVFTVETDLSALFADGG